VGGWSAKITAQGRRGRCSGPGELGRPAGRTHESHGQSRAGVTGRQGELASAHRQSGSAPWRGGLHSNDNIIPFDFTNDLDGLFLGGGDDAEWGLVTIQVHVPFVKVRASVRTKPGAHLDEWWWAMEASFTVVNTTERFPG